MKKIDWNLLRKHPAYQFILWAALAGSLVLLWQMNQSVLSNPKYIPVDDFAHYWAAGRLNSTGENPYQPQSIQTLRDDITGGKTRYDTIPIMWTPPWSLLLVMPFGVLDYPLSRLLWLMAMISVLLFSTNLIWRVYQGSKQQLALAWLLAFTFGPTISVLEKGQITPVIVLAAAGFMAFHQSTPLAAGAFLALMAVKPQITYLLWPALLLWVLGERQWRVAVGSAGGLLAALGVAVIFNSNVIGDYVYALQTNPPADWATPTIGGYLRLIFGTNHFWLQFVPPVVGFGWFIYYWWKHRQNWNWLETMPWLLLVSVLTASYAWTYDHVVLIPAVLAGGVVLLRHPNPGKKWVFGVSLLSLNLLDLFLHRSLDEFWFGWLAPAWLIWYLLATEDKPLLRQRPDNQASTGL